MCTKKYLALFMEISMALGRLKKNIILVIDTIGRSIATLPVIKSNLPRNTRDYLVWITGNGGPMHEVYMPHSIPRA